MLGLPRPGLGYRNGIWTQPQQAKEGEKKLNLSRAGSKTVPKREAVNTFRVLLNVLVPH